MQEDKLNMIMKFADGTLESGKEDQLFLMLSGDDELKQTFKSHIDIKNAIRAGTANVVLPASSKSAVFSALSLDLPRSAGANKILWTATASLSIAVIALLMFLFNKNDSSSGMPVKQNNYITENATNNIKPVIPRVIAKENTQTVTQIHKPIDTRELVKKSASNLINPDIKTTDNSKPVDNDISLVHQSKIYTTYFNRFKNEQQLNLNSSFIGGEYTPISHNITLNNTQDISLEFRGSRYKMTKSPTITPKQYSPLNNMALAVSYNINNNLSTGLDLRQETFFLRYNSTRKSQEFIYEQQPNFTTISASVKYTSNGVNGLRPFASAYAGFNNVGFVGRAMLGAEYSIFDNLSLMFGLDFSNLTYTHQNNYFNSSKFGLNYGLIYSF